MQEFEELFAHTRLLNLMEQLLGTQDIVGHPVWNLRCKAPRNEATTVPWHQGTVQGKPWNSCHGEFCMVSRDVFVLQTWHTWTTGHIKFCSQLHGYHFWMPMLTTDVCK